jgi:hypothetical protein
MEFNMARQVVLVIVAFLAIPVGEGLARERVSVQVPEKAEPCIEWGKTRLEESLAGAEYDLAPDGKSTIEISVDPIRVQDADKSCGPESYRIVAAGNRVSIIGSDAGGAMYGCLELADRIRRGGRLPERLDQCDGPRMSLRGTCILLMKLGSYDYPITPQEFPFFYDRKQWIEYLDFLAEHRFNYIAFWNGHPFDYLVRLPKYPESQDGMEPGDLEQNREMLLWLAREAQKRHIWLMFQFYNIHTSVYFQKAHGLPAWNPKPTPLLTDYTSHCIERFVSEYPSVGLYICPGEALQLEYTDGWIKDVVLPAVQRTGKTPPIMVRAWGIDLPHMKKLEGSYPRLYTEMKFNVEMVAGTEVDPENREWSKITGNHVVNVHCMGNLEPFRWSPPSFIQRCVQSSIRDGGATGLHLYPRKAWRWPYGCDRGDAPELQWRRDWMWFHAWARYAWNPERDQADEKAHWTAQLAERYGADSAPHMLKAFEDSADVLPGIQRLLWLDNSNHTLVASGITLEQLEKAPGIPFLPTPGVVRIPKWIETLKQGKPVEGQSPLDFLAQRVTQSEAAFSSAQRGAQAATVNKEDAERIVTDMLAVTWVAKFYRDKLEAASAKAKFDAGIDKLRNRELWTNALRESVNDFRQLTDLTHRTYESMSDVPAWFPTRKLPCPYHWTDLLPIYEKELAEQEATVVQP